jgi:hypothetical protein
VGSGYGSVPAAVMVPSYGAAGSANAIAKLEAGKK